MFCKTLKVALIAELITGCAARPAYAWVELKPRTARNRPPSRRDIEVEGSARTLYGAPLEGIEVQIRIESHPDSAKLVATSGQGNFQTDFRVTVAHKGTIEVSVPQTDDHTGAEATLDFGPATKRLQVDLIVRPEEPHEDAFQLPFEALVAEMVRRLGRLSPGLTSSKSDGEDFQQVVTGLSSGDQTVDPVPVLQKTAQDVPHCIECQTALGLALLRQGNASGAIEHLVQAATLAYPHGVTGRIPEPFLILGVLDDWQGDSGKAAIFFMQALEIKPSDPLALQELGRGFLLQRNWRAADLYLAQALSNGEGTTAHLIRAKAMLALGEPDAANLELAAFVGTRKPRSLPENFRFAWGTMKSQIEAESEGGNEPLYTRQSLPQLLHEMPELAGLKPAPNQEKLKAILEGVGNAQESFFSKFVNVSSDEQVQMEVLGSRSKVIAKDKQKFSYLLLASPSTLSQGLNEYRTGRDGHSAPTVASGHGYMLTEGFASSSIYLLRAYQSDSSFRYLGNQDMGRRTTYVVAFAQHPGVARLMPEFLTSTNTYPTPIQGIAWIDPSNFQIVRMLTDLLKQVEQIRLTQETTDIQYAPVHFQDAGTALWMPQNVTVTVKWARHWLRNQHSYSNYHLFQISTQEKLKLDKLRRKVAKNPA